VLHGGLSRWERRAAIDAFTTGVSRVLLATDAAGEGLNLHYACRCVVHLEVPWNPVRLEQRIGRVDRIGQPRTVHAFCLVSRHHTERNLLQRLARRVASADVDVGMTSPLESCRSSHDASTQSAPDAPTGARDTGWHQALARAAEAEADRVRRSRALRANEERSGRRASVILPTAVVARARPAIRSWLQGRALLLVEVVRLDEAGRSFASVARPMLVPVRSATTAVGPVVPGVFGRLTDSAREMVTRLEHVVGNLVGHLQQDSTFTEPAPFWSMVATRAADIARTTLSGASQSFQPGLFDRRAQRLRQLRLDKQAALAELMTQRLRRIEALSRVSAMSVGRALLLLP